MALVFNKKLIFCEKITKDLKNKNDFNTFIYLLGLKLLVT